MTCQNVHSRQQRDTHFEEGKAENVFVKQLIEKVIAGYPNLAPDLI